MPPGPADPPVDQAESNRFDQHARGTEAPESRLALVAITESDTRERMESEQQARIGTISTTATLLADSLGSDRLVLERDPARGTRQIDGGACSLTSHSDDENERVHGLMHATLAQQPKRRWGE